MADLKDFQRDTVDYVLKRLYDDPDPTDRFLVADEVGMGKTLVARGVIAGAIDRLQHVDEVDRIDVIYICSNSEIANQNIGKLDVRGDGTRPLSTRITMLATQLQDLTRSAPDGGKTVNLIAFTPGTSFEKGHRGGRVGERALIYWMLRDQIAGGTAKRNSLKRILQMGVRNDTWRYEIDALDQAGRTPDLTITAQFQDAVRGSELFEELTAMVDRMTGKYEFTEAEGWERIHLVGRLRQSLAEVSVNALEPDLVILDEFQRFKHLLEQQDEGAESEVSKLAHDLFGYEAAKVLLLSATPYKMYTLAEEREHTGDDHFKDFIATVDFLSRPAHPEIADELRRSLDEFRSRIVSGANPSRAKQQIESSLRRVMSRTERPVSGEADMLSTRDDEVGSPTPEDLLGFTALKRIAKRVDGQASIEYWKSAPYFLSFMDGYQLSKRFREHQLLQPIDPGLLRHGQFLTHERIDANSPIDPGNARLRELSHHVIDSGLWKLLWLPPSMPYHEPSGPYAEVDQGAATKRLIFSSWAAAPSAISALLSREVQRRIAGGTKLPRRRLDYTMSINDRPDRMTALALFMPIPHLAAQCDPLAFARAEPVAPLPSQDLINSAIGQISDQIAEAGEASASLSRDTWYWAAPFSFATAADHRSLAPSLEQKVDGQTNAGLAAHLAEADRAALGEVELGAQPDDLDRWVALLGLASPANIALRSIRRVLGMNSAMSDGAIERSAAEIAAGFHSMFNRPEVIALVDSQTTETVYWKSILEYCHAGNLQAVFDEYMHHLIGNESPADDEELLALAGRVRSGISIHEAPIQAFDPTEPDSPIRLGTQFAVRYGNAKGRLQNDDSAMARAKDVQAAFNSPFWPMVLASTSVGQEGIDFHWWCHAIVHWNIPSNPTDFEQREGRVHRFKGHAVRKNVAVRHRRDALLSEESDPWDAAFDLAAQTRPPESNDLWPWWIYPGPAKIERWIAAFPLSRDKARDSKLRRQRALYRLAFGQPRQEDLVEMLEREGLDAQPEQVQEMRLDLRPPTHS